jgi:hypothetical protein
MRKLDGEEEDHWFAAFRLLGEGGRELYLVLYNAHNGYYAHGFTMESPDGVLFAGEL